MISIALSAFCDIQNSNSDKLFNFFFAFFQFQWVEARDKFDEASVLIGDNKMLKRTMWGQFWSAHQRFFKYMCIASKVSYAVNVAKQAVKDGKCAVIGLQSTGEARTLDVMERADGELEDFVSTSK